MTFGTVVACGCTRDVHGVSTRAAAARLVDTLQKPGIHRGPPASSRNVGFVALMYY
jgi:hypothetical protein